MPWLRTHYDKCHHGQPQLVASKPSKAKRQGRWGYDGLDRGLGRLEHD